MPTLAYLQHNYEIEDLDERCLLNVQINDTGHHYSIEEKMQGTAFCEGFDFSYLR